MTGMDKKRRKSRGELSVEVRERLHGVRWTGTRERLYGV